MQQKHTRKFFRNLLTLALAGAMCLSATVTSFADEPETDDTGVIYSAAEAGATATLTKLLRMPEGTTTPAAKFTFEFEKTSLNGSTETADLAKMPNITDEKTAEDKKDTTKNTVSITFANTNVGSDDEHIKYVPLESPELVALAAFTEVGVYRYKVTEVDDTYTCEKIDTASDTFAETMDYSPAEYELTFWVREKADHSGVYVHAIAAKILVKDTEEQGAVNTKVDPTPGGDPLVQGDYSKMVFTNTYHKIKGTLDPKDPEVPGDPDNKVKQSLHISKKVVADVVDGEPGAGGDTSKYFEFKVTVEHPATLTGTVTYHAYIVDASDAVVTSSEHVTGTITGGSFEVEAGTEITVNLKHGERIVFNDLHVGARYTAIETAVPGYKPGLKAYINNKGPLELAKTTANVSLSTAELEDDEDNPIGEILIGEKTNNAAFTNTYNEIPITGVIVNNLPFILLIVAAAGGFAFFMVVKYRKREHTED